MWTLLLSKTIERFPGDTVHLSSAFEWKIAVKSCTDDRIWTSLKKHSVIMICRPAIKLSLCISFLFCFVCSVHDTSVFLSNINCHFECVTYFIQVLSALKHAFLQIAFLVWSSVGFCLLQRTVCPRVISGHCASCYTRPAPGEVLRRCTQCWGIGYCNQ